jgi:hypothetical protein
MSVLAETHDYLVEYDQWAGHRLLVITDKWNGFSKTMTGPRIAGDFKDCLTTHSPSRVIETWLKIMRNQPWQQTYKPLVLV